MTQLTSMCNFFFFVILDNYFVANLGHVIGRLLTFWSWGDRPRLKNTAMAFGIIPGLGLLPGTQRYASTKMKYVCFYFLEQKPQNQSLKYQLVWSHSGSLRIFTRLNELLSSHILARDDFLKLKMSAFLQMLSYLYLFLKSRKGKCHFWLVTLCAWGTIIRDEYLKRKKKVDFL